MPAVFNRRLSGYVPGPQQFDYPMHLINVISGSTSVSVSPGAQTGLFSSTGPMDPHSYRPNEFFISNWIYEGLVSYGHDGQIMPQLATSWTVTDTSSGDQIYRFTLRSGVKFHDGTDCNCLSSRNIFQCLCFTTPQKQVRLQKNDKKREGQTGIEFGNNHASKMLLAYNREKNKLLNTIR